MHAEQQKVAEHAEHAEQNFSKRAERAEQHIFWHSITMTDRPESAL